MTKCGATYDQYCEYAMSIDKPLRVYAPNTPTMLNYNPLHCLPAGEDLPDSDDEPVDNQLQHLIPGLLEAILAWLWASRMDCLYWYDEQGVRFLIPEERAIAAEQRAQRLAQELRKLGIDPDALS